MSSFSIALSGLSADSAALDVVGNNLANFLAARLSEVCGRGTNHQPSELRRGALPGPSRAVN